MTSITAYRCNEILLLLTSVYLYYFISKGGIKHIVLCNIITVDSNSMGGKDIVFVSHRLHYNDFYMINYCVASTHRLSYKRYNNWIMKNLL
jgi:hypothetical protein